MFGCLGSLGVYTRYLHYICDICSDWRSVLFPKLGSDYMFFCFKISSDGCLLTCGYHFKKRFVREGGEWITYHEKTPSAYDVVPMLILEGRRLNLPGLFTLQILVVCGYKCMGKRWFFVPPWRLTAGTQSHAGLVRIMFLFTIKVPTAS